MREELTEYTERLCIDTDGLREMMHFCHNETPEELRFLVSKPFVLENKSFVMAFPIDIRGVVSNTPMLLLKSRFCWC